MLVVPSSVGAVPTPRRRAIPNRCVQVTAISATTLNEQQHLASGEHQVGRDPNVLQERPDQRRSNA